MKRITRYFSTALLAATVIFSSCKKDDPTPETNTTENPNVSLTMSEPAGTEEDNQDYTVFTTDNHIVMEVKAISEVNNDLKRLYVYKTKSTINGSTTDRENVSFDGFKNDGSNDYYEINNDNKNDFTIRLKAIVDNDQSREEDVYCFYFTDNTNFNINDQGDHVVIGPGTITLAYDSKLQSTTSGQKIYSICNPDQDGAYNLETFSMVNTSVDGSNNITIGSNADFSNQDDEASCDAFRKGWTGQNGTYFRKANDDFNYDNATHNSLKEAYGLQIAESSNINDVEVDAVYIARLKGTQNFAVIKITGISDLSGTNDYIEFSAKRK